MKTHLVVTAPFGDHAKGDHITDPDAMAAAVEQHHAHVVRVATPEEPPKPRKAAD
jgi:hypothetical protein